MPPIETDSKCLAPKNRSSINPKADRSDVSLFRSADIIPSDIKTVFQNSHRIAIYSPIGGKCSDRTSSPGTPGAGGRSNFHMLDNAVSLVSPKIPVTGAVSKHSL